MFTPPDNADPWLITFGALLLFGAAWQDTPDYPTRRQLMTERLACTAGRNMATLPDRITRIMGDGWTPNPDWTRRLSTLGWTERN